MDKRIRLDRRTIFIAAPLIIMLAVSIGYAFRVWTQVGGGSGMDSDGFAALMIGAVGSLILGGGLMALVFFSSRRGYDDAADLKLPQDENPKR